MAGLKLKMRTPRDNKETTVQVGGVVLAGGVASRMNYQDKPLLNLAGQAIIEQVITNASKQVNRLVLSVNRNTKRYAHFGLPIVKDIDCHASGPLVGIVSAMQYFKQLPAAPEYVASFPADVPLFPNDLVNLMIFESVKLSQQDQAGSAKVIWCRTGDQVQPLFSLWPLAALPELTKAITAGIHGPMLLFKQYPNHSIDLPMPENGLFFNINSPDDLQTAHKFI
jgi:molybdopterin-guanine dinucleotide biosynthesis protein A